MKNWLSLLSVVFIVGCQNAEVSKNPIFDPNSPQNNVQNKPVNGRLTLDREFLKVGSLSEDGTNEIDVSLNSDIHVMTKDYYFVSDNVASNYQLVLNKFDDSLCTSTSKPRFFLIKDGIYNEVDTTEPFTLNPAINYRLQMITEKMNCTRLKISFSFIHL